MASWRPPTYWPGITGTNPGSSPEPGCYTRMRLSSLGKHPIRCGAAPLAGWVGAGMVSVNAWSLNSISAESAELDVSPRGFAELGHGSGKFVVATGSPGEVARTLRAARLDQAAVRLELDDGRTRIRPLSGGDAGAGWCTCGRGCNSTPPISPGCTARSAGRIPMRLWLKANPFPGSMTCTGPRLSPSRSTRPLWSPSPPTSRPGLLRHWTCSRSSRNRTTCRP